MTCRKQSRVSSWNGGHSRAASLRVVDSVNLRRAVFGHSSTTSVPFMFLWPKPQTLEQRNWKVPALSAVNSTMAVVPFRIF